MLNYSVVAICRNEGEWIENWIKSVRKMLDPKVEIILVDTGSNDNTLEIARKYGCQVHEVGEKFVHYVSEEEALAVNKTFKDDVLNAGQRIFNFRDARNHADSFCKTEWAISLDLRWNITKVEKNFLSNIPDDVSILNFTLRLKSAEFSTGRIYRVKRGKWRYAIHELFDAFVGQTKTTNDFVCQKISTEAHSYLPHLTYEFFINGQNYSPDSPDYSRMLYYTAREIYYQGKKYQDVAKKLLEECVANKGNWFKERSQSACYRAEYADDINERRHWYILAIACNPVWREPYLKLADLAYKLTDWFGMLGYLNKAQEIKGQEGPLHVENESNYGAEFYRLKFLALVQVARTFRMVGSLQRAIEHVEEAIKIEDKLPNIEQIGHLGWIEMSRVYHDSNPKKAKIFYNKAVQQRPDLYTT